MKNIDLCPICGNREFRHFGVAPSQPGLHSRQVECTSCNLLISQPQAEAEKMISYYRNDYYQKQLPEDTVELETSKFHLKKIFRLIDAEIRSSQVLEVGCGYGKMLSLIQGLGNTCVGCDLSHKATAYAKRIFRLNNLICGDAAAFRDEAFDLVLSFHVIEHLPSPVDHLRGLIRLTKPRGRIVIGTECSDYSQMLFERTISRLSGQAPYFVTSQEHTFVFNRDNLTRLFADAGLEEIRSLCYNEVASQMGRRENLHWLLYKGAFRFWDHLFGRGSYLLVSGMKGQGRI